MVISYHSKTALYQPKCPKTPPYSSLQTTIAIYRNRNVLLSTIPSELKESAAASSRLARVWLDDGVHGKGLGCHRQFGGLATAPVEFLL